MSLAYVPSFPRISWQPSQLSLLENSFLYQTFNLFIVTSTVPISYYRPLKLKVQFLSLFQTFYDSYYFAFPSWSWQLLNLRLNIFLSSTEHVDSVFLLVLTTLWEHYLVGAFTTVLDTWTLCHCELLRIRDCVIDLCRIQRSMLIFKKINQC